MRTAAGVDAATARGYKPAMGEITVQLSDEQLSKLRSYQRGQNLPSLGAAMESLIDLVSQPLIVEAPAPAARRPAENTPSDYLRPPTAL